MKVLKNFILNSSYQLLIVIIPIITIPYISRVLGPHGVGLNTFTNSIVAYFILFGSIGISTYGNREIAYHQNDKKKRSQLFWEISFLRLITISIAIIAFLIFLIFQNQYRELYLFQALALLAAGFDISWYFMGVENFKRTVVRNFFVQIISVICIFTFVHHASDLPIYILIVAGTLLIGNLSLWPYLKKEVFAPQWKKIKIKRHLQPTLLLFIPQIATQIYLVLNKTMIGLMDSLTASGYFSQSDAIIKTTLAIVTSLGVVMLPHVSNMHAQGNSEGVKASLRQSFDIMTAIAIPLMFGIMAISLKFAPLFFGSKFAIVGTLMMMEAPIILFIAWSNVLGIQYLLPLNRMKHFTTSVTVGAVLNIMMNLIMIPLFGVIGAMVATVIAELSVTLYQMYVVRADFHIVQLLTNTWKYWIAGLVMFLVVFTFNRSQMMNLQNLILQIVIGGIIYIALNFLLRSNIVRQLKSILPRKS